MAEIESLKQALSRFKSRASVFSRASNDMLLIATAAFLSPSHERIEAGITSNSKAGMCGFFYTLLGIKSAKDDTARSIRRIVSRAFDYHERISPDLLKDCNSFSQRMSIVSTRIEAIKAEIKEEKDAASAAAEAAERAQAEEAANKAKAEAAAPSEPTHNSAEGQGMSDEEFFVSLVDAAKTLKDFQLPAFAAAINALMRERMAQAEVAEAA